MKGQTNRSSRNPRSGVTLIEMLAALVIFSLIGIAGFSLLDQSLRSRSLAQERLDRLGEIERTIFILKQDLLGAFSAHADIDDETGQAVFVLRPSGIVYFLREGTLYRGNQTSEAVQAVVTRAASFDILAFPSGRSANQISIDLADDVWNTNLGFQVLLGLDGVGTVEIVSPNVRQVPAKDDEFGLQ